MKRLVISATPNEAERDICYNASDTLNTWLLREALSKQLAADENYGDTYWYLQRMLGPVMTMMRRGIKVDEKLRAKVAHKTLRRQQRAQAQLNFIARSVWGKALNPASPKQMVEFFRDWLCVPESDLITRKGGEAKITTDTDKLKTLAEKHSRCAVVAKLVIRIRELDKELDMLSAKLLNGRMMTSYNLSGTETLRLSSSSHPFWCGCVDGNTEILTTDGWVPIRDAINSPKAAVWNKDSNEIIFEETIKVSRANQDKLYRLETEQVSGVFTLDHKHAYKHPGYSSRQWLERKTKDLMNGTYMLPVAGLYPGGTEYPEYNLRLMVACLADGSLERGCYRLSFFKQRKINRLIDLCTKGGISYGTQKPNKNCKRFTIKKEDALISLTGDVYGKWLLTLGPISRAIIFDELKYWDSHIRNNSYVFFSKDKEQCNWLQTAAHLTNLGSTQITVSNNRGYGSNKTNLFLTKLNIKPRNYVNVEPQHWKEIDPQDNVYCLQTSTGYFLIKHEGKVSITGNSNVQNIDREMRHFFVADKGMTFVQTDQQGAEAKAVAYLSGDENYIKAVNSEDVHTFVASISYGIPNDRTYAEANKVPGSEDSYRQLTKKTTHGTNYYATPWTVAQQAKIKLEQAENFQLKYFKNFPKIQAWHKWHQLELKDKAFFVNPFGFKRRFWDRPWDDTTLREAIANVPQSMVGIITNIGLYRLWLRFEGTGDLELLANGHDAEVFQVKTEKLDEILEEVMPMITMTFPVKDITGVEREMTIPMDATVGPSWGKREMTKWPSK